MGQMTQAEKIREKIKQRRVRREQESKLLTLKRLGDSDEEEESGGAKWVEKQKRLQKEKEAAAKRAKMLAELDDEFGVGNLVEEETKKDLEKEYGRKDLRGLKVEHAADK